MYSSNWGDIKGYRVFIKPVTQEEVDIIAKAVKFDMPIDLDWAKIYKLTGRNIKACGEFNIKNKINRNYIEKLALINLDSEVFIYSGFKYSDACANFYKGRGFTYHNTWNNLKYFGFCYTLIGRPERICIYVVPYINYKNANRR